MAAAADGGCAGLVECQLRRATVSIPVEEVVWLVADVAAAGVITGLLAGLFGIGGGAVIVPVLFELFRVINVSDDLRMQLCIGTSLAIIVLCTLRLVRRGQYLIERQGKR
jgi:uncharacterized membrane protein YfcA